MCSHPQSAQPLGISEKKSQEAWTDWWGGRSQDGQPIGRSVGAEAESFQRPDCMEAGEENDSPRPRPTSQRHRIWPFGAKREVGARQDRD